MLKRFSDISMKDVAICGGKGASLGEMMSAGLPIPNGFVLTTKAYGTDSKKWGKEILEAFDELDTKFVAVRSSGTKEDGVDDSFAGQFDTYLFVTRENLIEKIKECHDSVNSERIISYCDYKGIDRKSIKVAVVIQKMVNSDSAGVCFTVNPVSQNHDEIMIDAGYGLGEAVVSGMITPDNYIVNKKTGEIKKNISQQEKKLVLSDKGGTKEVEITEDEQSKQKLSDDNIKKLSELAVKIENHYGKPMDTEWAVENGELFILQARPITTLGTKHKKEDSVIDCFLQDLKQEDIFAFRGKMSLIEIGVSRTDKFLIIQKGEESIQLISYGEIIEKVNKEFEDYWNNKNSISNIKNKIENVFKDIDTFRGGFLTNDLQKITDEEIQKLAQNAYNLYTSLVYSTAQYDIFGRDTMLYCMNKGLFSIDEKTFILASKSKLISFEHRWNRVLIKYLSEGIDNVSNIEYIFTNYWNTKSEEEIKDYLKTISIEKLKNVEDEYDKELLKNNTEIDNWYNKQSDDVKKVADFGMVISGLKDMRKDYIGKIGSIIYHLDKEMCRRENIDERGWAFISPKELCLGIIGLKNIKSDIEKRINDGVVCFGGYNLDWIIKSCNYDSIINEIERKIPGLSHDDTNIIHGQIGSVGKGIVKGFVKVVLSPDNADFKKGDILVTSMTRPEFLPLMKNAKAVITNEGGITCHAAIVSRELGIPCIIGTKIATQVLKDGNLVEVDADNGIVKVLENEDNNLEVKIGNKTFTPEFRSHPEVYFNYQAYPFFTSIFAKCYAHKETKWTTPCFYISEFNRDNNRAIQYVTGSFIEKGNNMIEDLLSGGTDASKLLEKKDKAILKCFNECRKYLKDKNQSFSEIWDKIGTAFSGGWHIFNLSHAMQEYLNKLKIEDSNLFEAISTNIIAPKKSFVNQAEDYLIELCKKYPKNFDKVYEMFMDEYGRFQNSYLGVNKNITKSRLKAYYTKISGKEDAIKKEKTKKIPENYKTLVKAASNATCYQDNKKKLGAIAYIIMEEWLNDISKKTKIHYNDLLWLTVDEILSYDLKSKTDIKNLKEKISKYKNDNRRRGIMTDKGYIDIDENFRLEVVKLNNKGIDGNIIHGVIGNKGKVTGRARIVLNIEKDAEKVNEGDVLVTGMTRPEFVPIMRKAGAFITDEGGITCHAAIISRELGKPCIIGTKIATQVLKDGDLVEVDADNGIVRILESDIQNPNKLLKKFNELEEYKQRDIQTFNSYPLFINSVATVSAFNLLPYNLHYTQILCEYKNDIVKWHYDIKDYEDLGKVFWENCKNTEEILKLVKKYSDDYKNSDKNFEKSLTNYKKNKTSESRILLLEDSVQLLAHGAGAAHILECASYYAEKYLTKGKLITPHAESFLSKAHKLAKKLKSENSIQIAYKKFLKEYGRIKNTYLGKNTISLQEFSDLANENDLKFTNPKYEKDSIEEIISYIFNWQDNRKENIFRAIEKVDDVLIQIAKDINVDKKTLCYMLPNEVLKIENKEFQDELKKRELYFIDYTTNNDYYSMSGVENQCVDGLRVKQDSKGISEIKGSIGNPGKATGIVHVCQSLGSIKDFKEGGVLVTSMTRPEFIPAMRKASAFVTDEGGITCHAAIISRELGKPCIIGTKIATQVLKDGDLVEVDADNGVVRIL